MGAAWSKSCSEANNQVSGSERKAELAMLERMAQLGLKNSLFLPAQGVKVIEVITHNAAAFSSAFVESVTLNPLSSPSSFLILSRNSNDA